jgi:4-hydroxyproline epimerase
MTRHTFFCIDAHTGGNPVRVVTGGGPLLPHVPMAEKREIFVRDHDWVRRALMFEPRGHDIMSGSILYPPARDDCELGILFIEVDGCLPMCGHGTIGTVTVAIEEGLVQPRTPGTFAVETPAGRVVVEYRQEGQYVEQVRLFNIPAYLHAADVAIDVPGLGPLVVDIAYGGNYYAIVEPQPGWAGLDSATARDLIAWSPAVRAAAHAAAAPVHPEDSRIRDVTHVMWCGPARNPRAHARNAVFYGDAAIDRSPCGTGSSARMAQRVARGKLRVGEDFVHESFIGSLFDCRVEGEARVGEFAAIRPSVAGWARVTGYNTIFVDDRDPFAHGFQVV